jgi:hypothetical protein
MKDMFSKSEPEVKATVIGAKFDKTAAQAAASKTESVSVERLDGRLEDPSPSSLMIAAAVQWVMLRYQPALTAVPPNIAFKMQATEVALRFPLDDGKREDIGKIKLGATEFELVITSAAFQQYATTASVNSGPVNPSNKQNAASTPLTPFASRNPSTVNSSSTAGLPSGSSAYRTPGASGEPLSPGTPGLVRSLQGFASLVGSLIQIKSVVSSLSVEVNVKDKELMAAMNGSHNEDEFPPIQDDGNDGERVLSYIKNKYKDLEMNGAPGSVTVLKAMELAEKEEAQRLQRLKQPVAVPIFRSNDTFLTLCVMLDFDEATEGAADVQLLFGSFVSDINGALLSRIMDHETTRQIYFMYESMNSIYSSLSLGEETAYVIDCVTRISTAVMSYHGVIVAGQDKEQHGTVASGDGTSLLVQDHKDSSREVLPTIDMSEHSNEGSTAVQLLQYYSNEQVENPVGIGASAVKSPLGRVSSATIRNRSNKRRKAIIGE